MNNKYTTDVKNFTRIIIGRREVDTNREIKERQKVIVITPGLYRHYKGTVYVVTGVALHTERKARLVIYYNPALGTSAEMYARPIEMWNELVTYNGKTVRRFTKID